MNTIIKINSDDIDEKLINGIKSMFAHKDIEIIISEAMDDTQYLMSSETNQKELLEAIKRINKGESLVEVDINEFLDINFT